jgi:hypothetical protein
MQSQSGVRANTCCTLISSGLLSITVDVVMTKSRRLEKMRKAFAKRDVRASALEHSPERIAQTAKEQHGGASDMYIGNMVYGGLDGILTTFAVVSGVAGANWAAVSFLSWAWPTC